MTDIFDDDVPVVEAAEEVVTTKQDELSQPVAKKFAFVGCGAAGGRIVDEFYRRGYRRTLVANTCRQDQDGLSDELEYIDLGLNGSGKDPTVSRECITRPRNRIQFLEFFSEILGADFDYVFVCAGLGGGTGSGIGPEMIKLLQEYIASQDISAKIGCILSLPQASEGSVVARNALAAYEEFMKLSPSPMILIDNARAAKRLKSSIASQYKDANKDATTLLHVFNTLAMMPSIQTFDGADFSQLLDSGLITFGVSGVNNWKDGDDIVAKTIMDTFKSATLAEVDVSYATQGVCIVVAGENVLNAFSLDGLIGGLNMLRNTSRCQDMMLHPAVYRNDKKPDALTVYVALGGLKPHENTLKQLAKAGNTTISSKLASFFGIA